MNLIEKITVREQDVRFYEGVDFDRLLNHPADGSKGFIFCFIHKYSLEMVRYNRHRKLESITKGVDFIEFDYNILNNSWISIYQTDGVGIEVIFETIKNKVLQNQFTDTPWIPASSLSRGAWKII